MHFRQMVAALSLTSPLLVLAVTGALALSPITAHAGGFETSNARVTVAGTECKKASVNIRDGQIEVDCKAGGYIRKLSELSDLRWLHNGGWSSVSANETDGSVFTVTVKKVEFQLLKQTMLALMGDGVVPEPVVVEVPVVPAPAKTTTTTTTTTSE